MSGILVATMKGIYKGRKAGSAEDTLKFLSKPQNKNALELLKMGVKAVDVAKAAEVRINTVTKIKRLGFSSKQLIEKNNLPTAIANV
jgi:hypothetical protein